MTKAEAIELIDERMCFGRGKWSEHHLPEIDDYWKAGMMAITALNQPEPQWIPCSERLPEEDVEVLVTDDAGGMATIEKDMCGTYENTGERFWYTSQNVTAWMPLPETYKGE